MAEPTLDRPTEASQTLVEDDSLVAAVPGDGVVAKSSLASKLGLGKLEVIVPGAIVVIIVLACLLAPIIPGLADPNVGTLNGGSGQPRMTLFSAGHLLGTDTLGRDLLSRCLYGGRISIVVGLGSVAVGLIVGGLLGIVSGYVRGAADSTIMRVLDVFLAFPSLILALVVATYLGPTIPNLIIAIAFFTVPSFARIARSVALSVRERDFVLSARLSGATARHVLVKHIVPRVMPSLLTYGLLVTGTAIIVEASLSFLGLGVAPPAASWGSMIADGKADLSTAPQIALVPGVFLFLMVVSLNLLADAIRNRLDIEGGAQ